MKLTLFLSNENWSNYHTYHYLVLPTCKHKCSMYSSQDGALQYPLSLVSSKLPCYYFVRCPQCSDLVVPSHE